MKTDKTETVSTKERAIDRAKVLLACNMLSQPAENIFVNGPVAITQIAHQNELNGILLGIGLPNERRFKLPISKTEARSIIKALESL